MNPSLFWIHKNVLQTMDKDVGFSLFSAGHLAWLVGIAIWIAATAVFYKKRGERGRDNMRKIMAVILILLETSKLCVMGLSHLDVCEHLPIHLCSLAGLFIVIDALWPKTSLIPQLFCFAFNTAALMALICSSATIYPFWNFYSIHIFVLHGYLLSYSFMRLFAKEYVPTYRGIWISTAMVILSGLPIFFIDGIFDVNYMFLGTPSDISLLAVLWNATEPIGGRFLYALSIAALGVVCMHVLYLLYRAPALLRALFRKQRQ